MKNILKEMYKQLPKQLIRNKWDLCFYLSNDVYEKEKHHIINGRFLGVRVFKHKLIQEDMGYLTEGNGFEDLTV